MVVVLPVMGGFAVARPVRCGAVPPLAEGFVARPESAPDLGAALEPGATVVLAPGNMGRGARGTRREWSGSGGKTQLAVSAAAELSRSGGLDLLIWITASSRSSVLSGYLEASAAALGFPPSGDSETAAIRFLRWLGESGRRWLVVLDDLSGAAVLDGLWPQGPAGTVLVTTPDPAAVPGSRRARVVGVGAFSPREAVGYLSGRLVPDPDQRVGAVDLIEELDCEPLALTQAAAVIAGSAQTCRDYREQFARRQDELAGMGGGRLPPAAVTWTLSVDLADQLSPVTAQFLLMLCSLLDGHEIPGGLFGTRAIGEYLAAECGAQQAEPERIWEDVRCLERVGLLTVDSGRSGAVRIHRVIQTAVRGVIPAPMLDRAMRVAAAALHEVWPQAGARPWLTESLRSGAASLQRAAGDTLWLDGCHPVLLRAGQSLDEGGLTAAAVAHWGELAVTGERILGARHPDTLLAERRLAAAHLAAGRPAEAAATFRRALATSTRTLGPEHPDVIAAQVGLGRALTACEQPGDAVTVLREAAAVSERMHGASHPDTLGARDEFAAACQAAGRFGDAITAYQRTLADRERTAGPDHPDTITTRQRLADAYLADGQIKTAVAEHKRAVADRERTAGPDHPDSIEARTSLAAAYFQAGRMASALQLFEQAGDDSERLLGADHPDTLARRASLANTYYSMGRLADAKTLLRQTADRCAQVLPPGDPLTQAVRESLRTIGGGKPL
jgi:tetratricopeptide (TPR) repeat protein